MSKIQEIMALDVEDPLISELFWQMIEPQTDGQVQSHVSKWVEMNRADSDFSAGMLAAAEMLGITDDINELSAHLWRS